MKRIYLLNILCLLTLLAGCLSNSSSPRLSEAARWNYPVTDTTNQLDDYHGVKVADPYRWLEDDHAANTKKWVEAQNRVTFGYLDQIPERPQIKKRLTELWNYERYGIPYREGGRYFFTKNDGLQNHNVLYTMPSLDAPPKVLLDPNTFSTDGTISLTGYSISDDGKWITYGTSSGGSDWQNWKVKNIETGKDQEDLVQWVKFSSASWLKDGSGFYYSRYDTPSTNQALSGINQFHKLYFHKLGTKQEQDTLVYHRPDQKEWGFGGGVTEEGDYLLINVWKGTDTKNLVFYQALQQNQASVVELLKEFEASFDYISNDGPYFYFRTDLNAPRGRIVRIDLRNPEKGNWQEILPQSEARLQGANHVGGKLIAFYLKDAHSEVKLFETNGTPAGGVKLPGLGSVGGFGGKKNEKETFYSYTSFNTPSTIYRYDISSGRSEIFRQPKVAFDPSGFETRQVFYQSKDGTRVPMFITHRKGLKLDGKNPTYLYA